MSAIIGCALPLSEDQFATALHNDSQYAKKFAAGWSQYERVSHQLNECFDECRSVGVAVKETLESNNLSSLFSAKIVILFAHWIDETEEMEFWGHPLRSEDIENKIPSEFSGILDLSVCHPDPLVVSFKRKPHRYSIKYYPDELLPSFWAEVYSATFRTLRRKFPVDIPLEQYKDMLAKVVKEFRSQEERSWK
jgi:hypothetical protein